MSLKRDPGKKDAVHLPSEILSAIISFVKLQEKPQKTLHSCCLVSRSWYSVAVAPLYESPCLEIKNCTLFVRTICPSKNVLSFESRVSEYVRTLNLSIRARESDTKKLLHRREGKPGVFVASYHTYFA
jgi:hypothetical protein